MKFAFLKIMYDLCSCEHILNTGKAIVVHRQSESLCEPFGAAIYCFPAVCVRSARGLFFVHRSICEHRTKLAPYCQSHSSTCTGPSGTPKGHSWISLNPSYCLQRKPARSRIRKPRRLPNTVTISARRRKQSGIVSSFFWNPWPGMILSPFPAVALNL